MIVIQPFFPLESCFRLLNLDVGSHIGQVAQSNGLMSLATRTMQGDKEEHCAQGLLVWSLIKAVEKEERVQDATNDGEHEKRVLSNSERLWLYMRSKE